MRELSVVNDASCAPDCFGADSLPRGSAKFHLLTGRFAQGDSGADGCSRTGNNSLVMSAYSMGDVVELESSAPGSAGPKRSSIQKAQRRRGGRSKTALVLGGGGFTGGVYEIGALRALDLLSVNRTVNEFDIYVGTSAGSFVAGLLAAGLTPEEMSRVVNRQVPTPFQDVDLGALLRPNYADFATRALLMPLRLAGLARSLAGRWREVSLMDVFTGLAEALPSGPVHGRRDRGIHPRGLPRKRPHGRLPAARGGAVPHRDGSRHVRTHRVRRRPAGTTCRSPRRSRRRQRCRWSTGRSRCAGAS